MPAADHPGSRKRKQRVAAACDFCRRRKLGCDNVSPRCGNCQAHEQQCTYATRVKHTRPSNTRIRQLEAENARLRGFEAAPQQPSPARTNTSDRGFWDGETTTSNGYNTSSSTILVSERHGIRAQHEDSHEQPCSPDSRHESSPRNREGCFHGPSSAMFDETRPLINGRQVFDTPNDSQHKSQLLAEATRQRQMEMINLKSKKLEFDGVESEMGMNMISMFWNRQHHSGSIVYRPAFMRDMACGGPYFSKLLLNAIFFSASEYLSRAVASNMDGTTAARCQAADNCTTGIEFRRKIEATLHDPESQPLFNSKVTTIQALLLVSDTLFSWCDEKSASWHYLGIAINMITDLGLHTQGARANAAAAYRAEDLEVNRRVFWAAFVLDKLQSVYQGRPARLREADNNIPILFLDEFDELAEFNTIGYSREPLALGTPGYSVSTHEQLCKLSIIIDRILCSLYTEKSSQRSPDDLLQTSYSLDGDLNAWRNALPSHLLESPGGLPALPHTISLLALYHASIILLHRPFVSDGHLQSAGQSVASDSFASCAVAASNIDALLHKYMAGFCTRSSPYTISYATYVSATIHLRIAAQRDAGSEAHRRLRSCLDVLSEHQTMCHASRRALKILKGLMGRLNVSVNDSSELGQPGSLLGGDEIQVGSHAGSDTQTTFTTTTPQHTLVAEGEYPSALDASWSDLDIDEIVRSFNLTPQGHQAHHGTGGPDAHVPTIDYTLDTSLQGLDMFPSFDALFGLEL